ncbi:MAG: prephenate dehydrogenase/arogenate dehydrogenase family protein [Verrucomicrobiae bacterium]|nr:prephenate dehydrogenase/arogenate dehydrogenase family protein [Verrucomicrobiae bacterium]
MDHLGSMDFKRVAVFGPGLLGGSLARAIRQRAGDSVAVQVWGRREEPLRELLAEGSATLASTDPAEAAAGADLVILAMTIGAMRPCLEPVIAAEALAPGAVVTDVGSVKGPVVAELESLVADAGGYFIGSHPMAGSEQKGLAHASADLFEGAACLITPTEASQEAAVERIDAFWQWLGCRTSRLNPKDHDETVARISHLPHLVAALVVEAALRQDPGAAAYAGGGFRDTTRVASGPADMWTEILLENRDAVRETLAQFHALTGETLAFLDGWKKEDLHRLLADAKERRDRLRVSPS